MYVLKSGIQKQWLLLIMLSNQFLNSLSIELGRIRAVGYVSIIAIVTKINATNFGLPSQVEKGFLES